MNNPFDNIGKMLIVGGFLLVAIGLILVFFNKIPFLGKLPGDILVKKENFSFYFPLASSIIISIVISLILFVINKMKS